MGFEMEDFVKLWIMLKNMLLFWKMQKVLLKKIFFFTLDLLSQVHMRMF